ncbi:hypothetical protein [Xenorhabdus szentirmaii]|uniref:hypothetical protein n=1 Tax=Xenorhabdus szentirmaii TaxID=290112 RepID=UPI0019B33B5A|nr:MULTISPECIES: hypothetical protein [unclassified Xenorhabdus]MBD2793072.1 hypothetical protein [Xenorhabdus sp. CUL]MBD2824531.1 hypothetical protein [Xenorhabdus sp. 5]
MKNIAILINPQVVRIFSVEFPCDRIANLKICDLKPQAFEAAENRFPLFKQAENVHLFQVD